MDTKLQAEGLEASHVGIINALKCYKIIEQEAIKNVRALFASTGVKGDTLSLDYYIRKLLVPNAINTAPLETIKAFIVHTQEVKSIEIPCDEEIEAFFNTLAQKGIDMNGVYQELMLEGLNSFKEAFVEILNSLK